MMKGELFCTKRGNTFRFTEWANRLVCVRCGYAKGEEVFRLYHLREAPGAIAERAFVGQVSYLPAFDIDRYVLECRRSDGTLCECAAFERVKGVLEALRPDAIRRKGKRVEIHVKGVNGKWLKYIRGGDGDIGMIADSVGREFAFLPSVNELNEICKCCNCMRRKRGVVSKVMRAIRQAFGREEA